VSGRKKRPLFAVLLLLLTVTGSLVWWFWPQPLIRESGDCALYYAEMYAGGEEMDVKEFLDQEQVLDILRGCRCDRSGGRSGAYAVRDGMVEIGLICETDKRRRHIVAYPDRAFAYDTDGGVRWRILDGGRLWQELSTLFPEGT